MRRATLLVVLLLSSALVMPATASPQPTPICRFCGEPFEAAAADAGVNASVSGSEVVVAVHANGSATWTVRQALVVGADAFTADPGRLRDVARSLEADDYGLPQAAVFIDASLDGSVAVLRYRVEDVASHSAGLLVVDTLHDRGYERWYVVNTERFTIRGPPGTVIANDPASGEVDGADVTWQGASGDDAYAAPPVEGSPYVVYGPDRSLQTRVRANAAVALATWPVFWRGLTGYLLFQTAIFALLLGAVVLGIRHWRPRPRLGPLLLVIGALGVVGVIVPAVAHGPAWITGPPLLALGLVGLATRPRGRAWLRDPRAQALAVVGILVGAFLLLFAVRLALANEWSDPGGDAFRALALAFPLAAMVPLGGALARRSSRTGRWAALAVLGFAAVPASVVNLADPPAGLAAGIFTVGLIVAAIVAPLLGTLGLALGWSLAAASRRAGEAAGTTR